MPEAPPITDQKRPRTRPPGPLAEQLIDLAGVFARNQHQLVIVAAMFADSAERVADRSRDPVYPYIAARASLDLDCVQITARSYILAPLDQRDPVAVRTAPTPQAPEV